MRNPEADTDVLIVGAGPVGLFLANECARRGLRFRIVETRASQSEHSKALAIFPRTLEIFDMAGVVEPFVEAANRVTAVEVLRHGRPLAHVGFAPEESPYPFIAMVPQDVTERLLLAELRRSGGDVEYQITFRSADQHGGGVRAMLERNGETIGITASFVIGCDGAHSTVRHLLNLPFEGAAYDALFILADVETDDRVPADVLQLCPSEFGPLAIFPMSATRRRIVATVNEQEGDAPALDLVRRILAQRAPHTIEARALHWSSYFHIHHRHVARLRSGRFFIAGDAAHIHSPFGGQGMNTGLQDVWNLAWKLDLFLHGHGSEALLDSYGAERLPVIRQVIAMTHTLTRVMGTPSRIAQALRDTMIPRVSRLPPFQHAFVERLSELGIAYPGSPIVEGAGKRYFDDSLRGGDGVRSRFLLFVGEGEPDSTKEAALRLGDTYREVLEVRASRDAGLTFVRPDGYVALARHGRAEPGALAAVRSLLERQINPSGASDPTTGSALGAPGRQPS